MIFFINCSICPNTLKTICFQAVFNVPSPVTSAGGRIMSKSFSDIVNVCFGNLVMGICHTFNQYLRELIVLSMYNGYRPVSPYTMWFGVLLLTYNSLLQAKRCADSMTDTLAVPYISDAYNSIGLICASKSWKKHCCV